YGFGDIALYIGGGVLVLLLLSVLADLYRDKGAKAAERPEETDGAFDPMAGGFPVPPMPGQQVPPVPRR
ncbi:NADH-quinone oxidoreductase subunit H, partial [Streptomyces sp. SID6648]|nr:NADH-quinone oxidoreductase subunit H [Streptomyces sp. SID6648]